MSDDIEMVTGALKMPPTGVILGGETVMDVSNTVRFTVVVLLGVVFAKKAFALIVC